MSIKAHLDTVPSMSFGAWFFVMSIAESGQNEAPCVLAIGTLPSQRAAICLTSIENHLYWSAATGIRSEKYVVNEAEEFEKGTWTFVAAVYDRDASTVTLYVDNTVVKAESIGILSTANELHVGQNLHGYVDNVFVYADALGVDEIDLIRHERRTHLPPRAGSAGYGLHFAGSSFLQIRHSKPLRPNNMTLCVSIRADSGEQYMVLASQGIVGDNGMAFELALSWHRAAELYRATLILGKQSGTNGVLTSTSTNASIAVDSLVDVCVTSDNAEARIYFDGNLKLAYAHNISSAPHTMNDVIIGATRLKLENESIAYTSFFAGSMDNVRVWDRCLTSAQVLHATGSTVAVIPAEASMFARFAFDSGSGKVALDSGTGHAWASMEAADGGDLPSWELSPFQLDDAVTAIGKVPVKFMLNGSSSTQQPLAIKFRQLPANGTIYASTSLYDCAESDEVSTSAEYPITQPFVFLPAAHVAEDSVSTFTYIVCEESCSKGSLSGPASVLVNMQYGEIDAQLAFSDTMQIALENITVHDVDDGEIPDALMNVAVSVENDAPSTRLSVGGANGSSAAHILRQEQRFSEIEGSIADVNEAMETIAITMPRTYEGTTSVFIAADDGGNGGSDGESHTAEAEFSFSISLDHVPKIASIYPSEGPMEGGSFIRVDGSGFENSTLCVFTMGDDEIHSERVVRFSPTRMACKVPPFDNEVGGSFHLKNAKYESNRVQFRYRAGPAVDLVQPQMGPARGGTSVFISGGPFMRYDDLQCDFGGKRVAAEFITSSGIVCFSPPQVPGGPAAVDLRVSTNGEHVSTARVTFTYSPEYAVYSISPAYGPTLGGTTVQVWGSGFRNDSSLQCNFGGVQGDVEFVSASEIACSTPPRNTTGTEVVDLNIGYMHDSFASKEDKSILPFNYVHGPIVESVNPLSGPIHGGTRVVIETAYTLPNAPSWTCRFGDQIVPAEVFAGANLVCNTPVAVSANSVPVEVSYNGIDYISSFSTFEFFGGINVTHLAPSAGPEIGGVESLIVASGVPLTAETRCVFEFVDGTKVIVNASRFSMDSFSCKQPALPTALRKSAMRRAQVWLLPSHATSSRHGHTSAYFAYYAMPSIDGVSPLSGPYRGGTTIRIWGSHLHGESTSELTPYCSFGSEFSPATIINESLIECELTCSNLSTAVAIGYSPDGFGFVDAGVQFNYYAPISVFLLRLI